MFSRHQIGRGFKNPGSGHYTSGLGFKVTWFADFYHDLIGDSDDHAPGHARLLKSAAMVNALLLPQEH